MNRTEKHDVVSQMRDVLQNASLVLVTQQSGLTVDEVTGLRRSMRENQAEFKVLKNTLAQIAVKDTKLDGLTPMLKGPTALAYSADPIAAAKVVVKFANTNDKLKVIGGFLDGQILSEASVKALATLPSLDELRAKLVGLLQAPATKIARLAKEPGASVARVIAAKAAA